ncbi:MAG: DNA-binding protein [Oscillospiraceae bacterium]|nr:DNA-binding protein [Oscillospiraceae bacterium]
MDYKRFGNTIVARIDKGEEILEQMQQIAHGENIKLASVSGLGATNDLTVGVFLTQQKQYHTNHFIGDMEIVSLTGTISTMDGKYYPHLHLSAADAQGRVVGGHLNRAVISVTCEMVIQIIDGQADRCFDPETGINLFCFE